MTQKCAVLRWLEMHDGITTLEASDYLRVCRLSERIRELEAANYLIERQDEKTSGGAHVTRYRIQRIAYG